MSRMKNTLINGERTTRSDETGTILTSVVEYTSINLSNIYDFMDSIDENWITRTRVGVNDKLERISYQLYGNVSYWDIIMILNKKTPFTCLPFDEDTIKDMAINKVARYKSKVYGANFPTQDYERLYDTYFKELEEDNNSRFIIKVIKPIYIQNFLQLGYEKGIF